MKKNIRFSVLHFICRNEILRANRNSPLHYLQQIYSLLIGGLKREAVLLNKFQSITYLDAVTRSSCLGDES